MLFIWTHFYRLLFTTDIWACHFETGGAPFPQELREICGLDVFSLCCFCGCFQCYRFNGMLNTALAIWKHWKFIPSILKWEGGSVIHCKFEACPQFLSYCKCCVCVDCSNTHLRKHWFICLVKILTCSYCTNCRATLYSQSLAKFVCINGTLQRLREITLSTNVC